MNIKPTTLADALLAAAGTSSGLSTDSVPGYTTQQAGRMAQKLCARGELFPAKISHRYCRYFTTSAAAAEFLKTATVPKKKLRPRGDKQLRTDDRFDTARAVNENAAALKNSNRSRHVPSADDEAKTTRYPTPPGRYAPDGVVPRVFQNSDSMPVSAWARAVAP